MELCLREKDLEIAGRDISIVWLNNLLLLTYLRKDETRKEMEVHSSLPMFIVVWRCFSKVIRLGINNYLLCHFENEMQ